MSDIDINKVQQNIKELQDQNAIDFQQWKKLGQDIEKLAANIKLSDTHLNLLMKKIKADYEALRKIIVDENVQVQLNNKILANSIEINKNSQNITTKADKTEVEEVRKLVGQGVTDEQLKNAVQSKVDDGTIASIQIGNNSVKTKNIDNKQVTPAKTSFLKLNNTKNLFDGESYVYGVKITGDQSNANFVADENSNIAVIPIVGGKTYSILVKEEDLEMDYNGKKYFKYMTSPNLYTEPQEGLEVTLNSAKYGTSLTIITKTGDKYLYIYMTETNNNDKLIQVVEGTQTEMTINSYEECFLPNFEFDPKREFISVLEGKTWVFLGDSITFGTGVSDGYDYPTLIKNNYKVNAINGAVAGGRYAKVTGSEANDRVIAQQIITQAENIKKADIVSIKCGTNDFANVVAFGDNDSTSEYTFNGGINIAISTIFTLNPKVRLVLFTPIYRATQSYTDDKNSDDYPLGGNYLSDYCTQIENAGKRHHVPVFNLYNISGINRFNANIMLSDKLHLSDEGSEFLGKTIHGCVATLF